MSHAPSKPNINNLISCDRMNVLGRKFREKVSLQNSYIWSSDLLLMGNAHTSMIKEKDRAFQETYSLLQNVVDLVRLPFIFLSCLFSLLFSSNKLLSSGLGRSLPSVDYSIPHGELDVIPFKRKKLYHRMPPTSFAKLQTSYRSLLHLFLAPPSPLIESITRGRMFCQILLSCSIP